MKHHKKNRTFGRDNDQYKALIHSLARSFIIHGGITTTEAKAKELRPFVEKLITTGKKDSLATRRKITAIIGETLSKKVVEEISPRYSTRDGGYTRITKLPLRKNDRAKVAYIEFV